MQINRSIAFRRSHANIGDYVALMKPRVMSLVVFTALVGLLVAPGNVDPATGVVALVCIAAGAGAAGALNMWYDADIDAVMARTVKRPIPSGRVSRSEALVFGLTLGASAVLALGALLNVPAAALLAFTIFFYVVVYTMWLKRRTPHNIVIGGAAGALPPVIGWVAVTGHVGLEPLVLFLIFFLWTPPHFWALSLNLVGEYARAGVPILPVVAGRPKQNARSCCTASLWFRSRSCLGYWASRDHFYGFAAAMLGRTMVFLSFQLCRSSDEDRRPARRLFVFSMLYPSPTFAVLLMNGALPTRLGRNDGRLAILLSLVWIPSFSRYNKPESLNDFVKFYCAPTTCLSAQWHRRNGAPQGLRLEDLRRSENFGKLCWA